jgi:Raf kinase inhibitor-like YbhB/YbcL family protein
MPAKHTCDGVNDSPPLVWAGTPANAQSFAVVCRDLTLTGPSHYHWVIYNIPSGTTSLPENVDNNVSPANVSGAKQTYWSFGQDTGYFGPCPPPSDGAHTYEFSVFAFATATIPVQGTDPHAAYGVITSNAIGTGTLKGTFDR